MSELILKGVESEDELQLATDLFAKVHYDEYFEALRWLETTGKAYPGFHREHTRIAIVKGEIAGALRLNTDTLRIGEARLKTGGIGWVTTAMQHRHKGIARALMEDSLRYMRENGYHLSLLFGIPNFYQRFGFASALASYSTTLDVEEAIRARAGDYRIRKGKPGDIPSIQKIHAANDAFSSCSLIRSAAHYSSKWEQWKDVRVLTNATGRVVAYFVARCDKKGLLVSEMGVKDKALFEPLLYACAQQAQKEFAATISFQAPPNHPLIQHLLHYESTHEMQITRDSGGMAAIVDMEETLESMIPEWEQQVRKHCSTAMKTEVTLLVEGKSYRIRLHRGAIAVMQGTGPNKFSLLATELVQLLTGYCYLDEILNQRRRMLTLESKALLATIFPKRSPFLWSIDAF